MSRSRHPNGEIERAVQYAEAHHWSVQKSGPRAHSWGKIMCPRGHSEHQMWVWSTPKNPHGHARQIMRFVDRCEPESQEEVEELQPLNL
jgi:hypothetical protein